MTKQEINDWTEKAKLVYTGWEDEDGNDIDTKIYELNNELFKIEYCNGHMINFWDGHGYVKDKYLPIKVKAVTRTYTVTEYEEIK